MTTVRGKGRKKGSVKADSNYVSDAKLVEIQRLAEKATLGKMKAWIEGDEKNGCAHIDEEGRGTFSLGCNPDGTPDIDNARFLAACDPQTILALIAELISWRKHDRE